MSLEKALEENTAAIKALTAALGEMPTVTPKEKPKNDKLTETTNETAPKEKKKADKKADKPDYEGEKYLEEVKPLTLKTIKAKGREVVADVLDHFGADLKSAKDLTADQYDDYMEALKEVLGDAEDLA